MTMSNDDASLIIVVQGTDVLVTEADGVPSLPALAELAPWLEPPSVRHLLGRFGAGNAYGIAANSNVTTSSALRFAPVRSLFGALDQPTLDLVGRALALTEFETTHRFCGRCGGPTEPSSVDRARRCPRCDLSFYPRIPPAVITLIERDGQLLLARSARFPAGMFSAVAGFVEVGESLEEAAVREVREEVGVEVGELRYFASQPWPFGRSLMVGFFARYQSGEIVVDGEEIAEARFFDVEQLPLLPPPISIARKMIEAFLTERGALRRPR
jgi:NAD+ diphosphatase